MINKSRIIEVICTYKYDSDNIYTCDLHSSVFISENDVIEITGTHLEGQTDADVETVNFKVFEAGVFKEEVLKKFENLKNLIFEKNNIWEMRNNSFAFCSKLEKISGQINMLTTLPSELLKNCENLKVFDLYAIDFRVVPEDLFGMTRNLEEFRLNSALKIPSFPENLFQYMQNLRILDISGNYLSELSSNFLIATVNLEEVDVSFNEFEDQWKLVYALNGNPNLRKLHMHYNDFIEFDFRFFSQFQKLEDLHFGFYAGNFTQISWHALPSSLVSLIVNGIGENIPGGEFDRLVNLKTLELTGRGINNLHKNTFNGLENLVECRIWMTNIKFLHPELFMSLINLSNLDLGHNEIEELPLGIFAPLVNLGIKSNWDHGLKLNSNKISRLNANSFGLHPHLRFISFGFNRDLNEIEYGIFRKFHSNLTYVDLTLNKCVDGTFSGENLDDNEKLSGCQNNWNEIVPTTTSTTEATTPGGAGCNFKKFNIYAVIFIGLINFIKNKLI